MIQSLDWVLYANRKPKEKDKIIEAISSRTPCDIIVDRHRLSFDPASKYVVIDKASEEVPGASKIIKCRLPYSVLLRLLDDKWYDLTGIEWVD